MRRCLSFLLLLALLAQPQRAEAQQHRLKIATLAPEGSSWMRLFAEWGRAIEARSSGAVKLTFLAGGVAGDERDVLRKIRLGQLAGAAVTSIGLGFIRPDIRVLELPMLIRTFDELDFVRRELSQDLRRRFEERGFVLLAWGDVGPVHFFSRAPLRSRSDLQGTRPWMWSDDPLSTAMYAELKVTGVPLGVPDVLPALQTGMIDACYGSPLSTLALQWYTRLKYVSELTTSLAIGATVMSKREFDRLPPDLQRLVLDESLQLEGKLLRQIRVDNANALAALLKAGLVLQPPRADMVRELEQAAQAVRVKLEPAMYSREFRLQVEGLVADYRAGRRN